PPEWTGGAGLHRSRAFQRNRPGGAFAPPGREPLGPTGPRSVGRVVGGDGVAALAAVGGARKSVELEDASGDGVVIGREVGKHPEPWGVGPPAGEVDARERDHALVAKRGPDRPACAGIGAGNALAVDRGDL